MLSQAAPVALACAYPQMPEAMAMAKPGVIKTQFVAEELESAAKTEGANNPTASSTRQTVANFFILLPPYEFAARRWLPDTPLAAGITLDGDHAV